LVCKYSCFFFAYYKSLEERATNLILGATMAVVYEGGLERVMGMQRDL
jgi:hypothetical protein